MNDTTTKPRPAAATGQTFRGVLSPALTPFTADLEPDRPTFVAFCSWLLEQGANGLAVFGTTSEANSLSQRERLSLLPPRVQVPRQVPHPLPRYSSISR